MNRLPLVIIALLSLTGCTQNPANKAPEIVLLVAEPDTVGIADTVAFTCLATDADGDPLAYWWTAADGDFVNGAIGASIQWKAPLDIGSYLITVNVSDGEETVTGDLTVVVPLYPLQEGRDFADQHFHEGWYRDYEYKLAVEARFDSVGTRDDWNSLSWEQKMTYLPREGFTHELPTESERSNSDTLDIVYYEVIGYYIHQFGFGWDDVYDPGTGTYLGDDPGTKYYDNLFGQARRAELYASTWLRPR